MLRLSPKKLQALTRIQVNNTVARDYAALCCEEFGLTDSDKADILRASQMHTQFIAIRQYTRVVALTQHITQSLTESFLLSTEFKDHVRGSTARLIQHMQENPGVPKSSCGSCEQLSWRLRRKIKKSMVDNLDIGALAAKLCVKGHQPTNKHWRRFALLRSYMTDWEKLPCHPGRGRGTPYWSFIDTKLDKLRIRCTKPATEAAVKSVLKGVLKLDQERHIGPTSGPTKLPARSQIPEWQRDHGKAVADILEYTVEAYPDEDDDEEDAPDGGEPQTPDRSSTGDGGPQEDNREAPRTNAGGDNVESRVNNSRAPRVLVPETQESQSMGGTQRGWTGGALVDRHQRPTHTTSPISHPNAASTSQHRPN
ncbi:hypothetical protein BN14_10680 [Rhizoctonia solani AG-1 IB]|uniref:Uncharacterized protein n=1 Tax=Thanatephorus cucumeris (strain AG1-IB / isolate 7/3/14) TaxID=1108050 RepID=M5CAU3_THACB|nr:hypothetical protein BN14_10680 [Rhizoctonia solani AG-1 IB]